MERSDGSARSERSGIELDLRLREALEPRPEAVERIVRGAMTSRGPAGPERFRLAPALTVLAVLTLTAGLLVLAPQLPQPARQEPPSRQAKISIENVGDLLVVHHREGGRWLIRNGGPVESSLPSRSLIVIYGGKP
jgi:hypothetical protein